MVHYTNAAPANPFGKPIYYSYTPGINTANYWAGFNREPWIDLTVEMCQRAEARYGGRWGLWYDRVQPEVIYTNGEITSAATHHRDDRARKGAPTNRARKGAPTMAVLGGHAVWRDGSVVWRDYAGGWGNYFTGIARPRDSIWLYANHPGHCEAVPVLPPPQGRSGVPLNGFCHPDPAARRTAREKLRALF